MRRKRSQRVTNFTVGPRSKSWALRRHLTSGKGVIIVTEGGDSKGKHRRRMSNRRWGSNTSQSDEGNNQTHDDENDDHNSPRRPVPTENSRVRGAHGPECERELRAGTLYVLLRHAVARENRTPDIPCLAPPPSLLGLCFCRLLCFSDCPLSLPDWMRECQLLPCGKAWGFMSFCGFHMYCCSRALMKKSPKMPCRLLLLHLVNMERARTKDSCPTKRTLSFLSA